MKVLCAFVLMTMLALNSFTIINNQQPIKDYFTIPGPIEYNRTMFNLSWSSHPGSNYFKQEYIPANEKPDTYSKMLMIEAVIGKVSVSDAVKAKTAELEQRKKTDPSVEYQVTEDTAKGEYILDFVLSQAGSGKDIVEWNVYHYSKLKDGSGAKGIMLFAYSRRAYGSATNRFLRTLKNDRQLEINNFAARPIPVLQINIQ